MNTIEQLRKEKHMNYRRETWLPLFFEKYKKLFSRRNRAVRTIQKFVRKYLLVVPVNIDMVYQIPGVYLYRIYLDKSNLVKPFKPVPVDNNDKIIVGRSAKKYYDSKFEDSVNGSVDRQLEYAIRESKRHHSLQSNSIVHDVIKKSKQDYDYNYDLELARALSISVNDNKTGHVNNPVENSKEKENRFCICIDLRIYGDVPDLPINYNNKIYYLSNIQIDKIKKIWNRINPSTKSGMIYHQNMNFYKSLTKEIDKQ